VTERSGVRNGFLFTAGILCAGLMASAVAQLVPAVRASALHFAWPQSWSYFAELPEQRRLAAYDARDLHPLVEQQTSGYAWWGLRRSVYAQEFELAEIAEQIAAPAWRSCASFELASCRANAWIEIQNPVLRPTVCGDVMLAWERPELNAPIPTSHNPWQIQLVAAVNVSCSY